MTFDSTTSMALQRPSRWVQRILFAAALTLLLPSLVAGQNCTCGSPPATDGVDKSQARTYKLAAIVSILGASAIGVLLPSLGKIWPALSPEKNFFFLLKAFAAGVILATGYIHVLPDAFHRLTSPILTSSFFRVFPAAGFFAMVASIGALMIDALATAYFTKLAKAEKNNGSVSNGCGDVENLAGEHAAAHGHSHGSAAVLFEATEAESLRFVVIAWVLELGIVVHSVIIGLSLGVSQSLKVIKPLVVALSFHQFFQGMGLGGCIVQAKITRMKMIFMALAFAMTTPGGIAVGIWVTNGYNENSPKALILEGILNSLSAGMLIYLALVDLLAADFMSAKLQGNLKLQLGAYSFLLFGAGACLSWSSRLISNPSYTLYFSLLTCILLVLAFHICTYTTGRAATSAFPRIVMVSDR